MICIVGVRELGEKGHGYPDFVILKYFLYIKRYRICFQTKDVNERDTTFLLHNGGFFYNLFNSL